MKILMAASEMAPFARTGDLADTVLALSMHLRKAGQEVSVVLPYYRCVRENKTAKVKRTKVKFSVQVGVSCLPCEIFETTTPSGVQTFLVARDEFFDRAGLYGADGKDYQDNSARFIFFTKCVIELARHLKPDVVHVHSWQTALLPVFAKDQRMPFVTALTPHGLDFQGNFWSYDFSLTNLPGEYFSPRGLEYYGSMNFLKAGILFSDAVILPSRRHIAEMQTPEYGCGLENVLREQSDKLEGIPNGLNDAIGSALSDDAASRKKARINLISKTGLTAGGRIFLADSYSTRGTGIGILLKAMDRLPSDDVRVLLLGPVPENERIALNIAIRRHAGRFANISEVNKELLQNALTAADFLLFPGPVAPDSELLLIGLRNGAIPIAAHCDGLRQFVQDFDAGAGTGNGFVFYRETIEALVDVIRRAMKTPTNELTSIVRAARNVDFSWTTTACSHKKLYQRLLRQAGHSV